MPENIEDRFTLDSFETTAQPIVREDITDRFSFDSPVIATPVVDVPDPVEQLTLKLKSSFGDKIKALGVYGMSTFPNFIAANMNWAARTQTETARKVETGELITPAQELWGMQGKTSELERLKVTAEEAKIKGNWWQDVVPEEWKQAADTVEGGMFYDTAKAMVQNLATMTSAQLFRRIPYVGPVIAFSAMKAQEGDGFAQLLEGTAKDSGIELPPEFVHKYADKYSYFSGIVEYVEQLAFLGGMAQGTKKGATQTILKQPFFKETLKRYAGSVPQNAVEEGLQSVFEYGILGEAIRDWNAEHPQDVIQMPDNNVLESARQGALMGAGFSTIGTAVSGASRLNDMREKRQAVRETYKAKMDETYEKTDVGFKLKEGADLDRNSLKGLILLNTDISAREAESAFRVMVDARAKASQMTSDEYVKDNFSNVVFDEGKFIELASDIFSLEQSSLGGIKLSKDLQEELGYLRDNHNEDPGVEDIMTLRDALEDVMQTSDEKDHPSSKFKKELRNIGIQLGVYKEVSKETLDTRQTLGGPKYDFKQGGKYYQFDSWDGLKALEESSGNLTEGPAQNIGTSPQVLAQFIGERATGKDPLVNSKYREAERLERKGLSPEEIRNRTGWFRLPDGGWRLPISDSEVKFNDAKYEEMRRDPRQEETTVKLEEIYTPSETQNILKYYPELKDVNVKVIALQGALAEWDAKNNTIILDRNLYGSLRGDALRHELQHAIGDIEGFNYDLQPGVVTKAQKDIQNKVEELKAKHVSLVERFQKAAQSKQGTESLMETIEEVRAELNQLMIASEDANYPTKLGEVEAFSVDQHRDFTTSELQTVPPLTGKEGAYFYKVNPDAQNRLSIYDGLNRVVRQGAKGAVAMQQDGRFLLGMFKDSDVSTLVHEFAHISTQYLGAEQAATLAQWTGTDINLLTKYLSKPYSLTQEEFDKIRDFEERFAVGFEKYLRTGKAPLATLKLPFKEMKEWLSRIYQTARSGALKGVVLTPEVKSVYDSLLLTEDEKLGGKISSSSLGKTILDVFNEGGKAMVAYTESGKTMTINVDNLIEGKAATKLQKQVFGTDVKWISPYAPTNEMVQDMMNLGSVNVTADQVAGMNRKSLERLARFAGIEKPERYKNDSHLRDLLVDISKKDYLLNDPRTQFLGEEDELVTVIGAQEKRNRTWENVKKVIGLPKEIISDYVFDLIHRVEHSGSAGKYMKAVANLARHSIDDARAFYGRQNAILKEISELARGAFTQKHKNSHLAELQEIQWEGPLGTAIGHSAIEGNYDLDRLSPRARKLVETYRKLVASTGKEYENIKMMIKTPEGKDVPFKADPEGKKATRMFTDGFWRIMTEDDGKHRAELSGLLALASGNKRDPMRIKKQIDSLHSKADTRHVNQETMRIFEDMPTHLKFSDGTVVQILHTDPMLMASHMTYEMGMRYGFVKNFGQKDVNIDRFTEDFVKAGGRRKDIQRMFRALNGIPVSERTSINPGTGVDYVLQGFRTFLNLWKPAKLAMASISNLLESPGKIPAYAGGEAYLKSLGTLMKDATVDRQKLGDLYNHALSLGAMSQDLKSLYLMANGKQGKMKTLQRFTSILGNKFTDATGLLKSAQLNEFISALAAENMNERLLKGAGSLADAERMRLLKFTEDEISQLMQARQRTPLHDAIVSRSPAITQGTNLLPAERSRFHNWAYAKDIIGFDSYSVNTIKRFYDIAARMGETYKKGTLAEKVASTKSFGKYVTGHTISGVAQMAIRNLIKFGPAAWMFVDWDEEDDGIADDVAEIMTEGMLYAMWGGPAEYITSRISQGENQIGSIATGMTLPVNVIQEIFDVAGGTGKYRNLSATDRVWKYLNSGTSLKTPVVTWASIVGLGTQDTELRVAMNRYYDWAKKNKATTKGGQFIDVESEKELNEEFAIHMKKALDAMDKNPSLFSSEESQRYSVKENLVKALGITKVELTSQQNARALAQRIRSKKTVTKLGTIDSISASRALSRETIQKLVTRDKILDYWANQVETPYLRENMKYEVRNEIRD